MKLNHLLIFAAVLGLTVSCQKEPEPTPESKTTYAVLLYGAGGGDLDGSFVNHISEVAKKGPASNVTLLAEFNYSARMQHHHPDFKGTFRYVLTGKCDAGAPASFEKKDTLVNWIYAEDAMKKMISENAVKSEKVSDTSIPLYKAENLKAFLNWAAETYPADKYILSLWNHGGGWCPEDEECKGIIYDDNNGEKCLSAAQTAVAINASKISGKVDVVYYDACNMNCAENIAELVGYTKYCVASCCAVPGDGADYSVLLGALENTPDDMLKAIKTLCIHNVDTRWHIDGQEGYDDVTIWDVNSFGQSISLLKTVAELVTADYKTNGKFYDEVIPTVRLLSKDIVKDSAGKPTDTLVLNLGQLPGFLDKLAEGCPNADVRKAASSALKKLDDARIYTHYADGIDQNDLVWCGVTIMNKELYKSQYSQYSASFDNSVFYKKTGWNKMFEKFAVRMTDKNPCFE